MPIVYATLADMQATFQARDLVQLSDWDDTGELDQARIERAIAKAGTKIDGRVAVKYGDRTGLPVPDMLRELACDMAFYYLHRAGVPDEVKDRYKSAEKTLADIAAGTVKIDEGVVTAQPARPGAIHFKGRKRFTRDSLDGAM